MNIYHYRHIMVANTPGKLNIMRLTQKGWSLFLYRVS